MAASYPVTEEVVAIVAGTFGEVGGAPTTASAKAGRVG